MYSWFHRLPLTVRLPLTAAGIIFLGAFATTQAVIYSLSLQFETQMDRLSQVYLDGLSAALAPSVKSDARAEMTQILEQAFAMHLGVVDRRLLFLDPAGVVIAHSDREGLPPLTALPRGVGQGRRGIYFDRTDNSMWAWREMTVLGEGRHAETLGTTVANLDMSQFVRERSRLQWTLTSMDVFLSGLCALIGFFLVRQMQRSVTLLAKHLENVAENGPHPVPAGKIPARDWETLKLIEAFNRMAKAAHEREAILGRMAEQEREAVLGRMAATLAHEVRNPLAGVLTALNTLRKFGDDAPVRRESIDFMERGLLAIQEVADAALNTHRPAERTRQLTLQDLLDVQRLAKGEARRRGVEIQSDIQVPDAVPVSATEVRQVLLNLILNATQATDRGGVVKVQGRVVKKELRLEVMDQGPGITQDLAKSLEHGSAPTDRNGLGVDVIVRLMERLQGRVSVEAHSGRGTHIVLSMPFRDEIEP